MAISNVNLPVTVTPFPPGTCFQSDQDLANAIAAAIQVTFPGKFTPWNIGPSQPGVNDRDKPWLQTDSVTNTITGIFTWSPFYGVWASDHWLYNGGTPPLNERRIFVGTLSNLETYDGGSPGTVSPVTGPFWVQDTAFNDLVPIGVNSVVNAPLATANRFTPASTSNSPDVIGVYFIMPSGRIFDVGS